MCFNKSDPVLLIPIVLLSKLPNNYINYSITHNSTMCHFYCKMQIFNFLTLNVAGIFLGGKAVIESLDVWSVSMVCKSPIEHVGHC